MGRPKQLLPWRNNSLISYAIEKSLELEQLETFVVVGANAEIIKQEIDHFPVTIIHNKDWRLGMGTSIRSAIHYVIENTLCFKGGLITLVDQPLIDLIHLRNLISEFNQNQYKIIATEMKSGLGVPAIFPSSYFKELLNLKEDYGARHILRKQKDTIIAIPGENKVYDIDTMEQYQALLYELKGEEKHSDI